MSVQDGVSDMFIRIKNAQAVGKKCVQMPASKLKVALAKLFKQEGYLLDYELLTDNNKPVLLIFLKYYSGKPVIELLKRVSRSRARVYRSCDNLPKVMGGLGVSIVSTSKGLMTDREARAAGCGGELIGIIA